MEARAEAKIADDVKGDGQIFVENFGVETNLFFRRECIEHAANGIHFAGDVLGGAAFGAFEDHVLDEMSDAIFGRDFAAGTVANPDADRDGTDMGHGFRNDNQAVGKNVSLNVANLRGHKGIVT
ncbi:MAG: hypothetical protein NVS9B14_14090 [Candidatus Acidiferrum sp.]